MIQSGIWPPTCYRPSVLRVLIPLIGLAVLAPSLPGQERNTPDKSALFIKGITALEKHLPDLAIAPLESSLLEFKDDPQAQTKIRIKLAEALVRAGRLQQHHNAREDHANSALNHLEEPLSQKDPSATFWSAHAYILLGKLTEATTLFEQLEDTGDKNLRDQSSLSRAHILSALGHSDRANALLEKIFDKENETQLSQDAALLRATILIAKNMTSEAEQTLDNIQPSNPQQQVHVSYLRARLAALGNKLDAIAPLRSIIEDTNPIQPLIRHSAQVFLAECLSSTGKPAEAFTTLVRLIDTQPRSPLLEISFHRLHGEASTPPLRKRLTEQLSRWADFTPSSQPDKSRAGGEVIISPGTETRTGYALFYHAISLAQRNTSDSNEQAKKRLSWMAANMPRHPFWDRAILEMAKLQIADRKKDNAINTLTRLEASSGAPAIRQESARLLALLYFEGENFNSAASAFLRAHRSLPAGEGDILAVNAGVSLLRAGDKTSFRGLLESIDSSEARVTLLLERALYEASLESDNAEALLQTFLDRHPDHHRSTEARLALLEAAVRAGSTTPPALKKIGIQIASLDAANLSPRERLRHLNLHLTVAGLTRHWEPAIKASKQFLKTDPASRITPFIRFKIAEAHFHNGDMLDAQTRFQDIASSTKNPEISETALFYAARSALKVGGENSDADAEVFLNTIIEKEGSFYRDAKLLLARSQINRHPEKALDTLTNLLNPETSFLLDAHMLAAEAHRELGEPSNLVAALKIYDLILLRPDTAYSLSNRLFFLKGQIFEDLKKSREALEAYYHVVQRHNLAEGKDPSEWFYFSRCAFAAVELLSKGALPRWAASVEILRIVENSASPWRDEAGRRRLEIELEHQLFDGE